MYQERTYRNLIDTGDLATFRVVVQETDLQVHADRKLVAETRELVLEQRGYVEAYIKVFPDFMTTLNPWRQAGPTAKIVSDMIEAGAKAGVGPMAAIAGAVSENVGRGLLTYSDQIIVENGGDVYIKTDRPVTVGIFAGSSPLSMQVGIQLSCVNKPTAVCTSSGTLGHSLSFGKADAVSVVADSCALADAAATSIGNLIQSEADIKTAIATGQRIAEITGIVIIAGQKIGAWGDLEIVPIHNPPK
ncbi:MAG: UPF0280 family protein [bacterium]|nr:UPF0280 family protein [bacterium]